MDDLAALDSTAGRSIQAVLSPTFQIFAPLLLANKDAIKAITPTTHSYGSHPRQELDVYAPLPSNSNSNSSSNSSPSPSPILIFFHGGGLNRGDKILPHVPEQLVYANLGTFFASRGITTVVPNYRRVNSAFGGEDAQYPSGGDDVTAVLSWLERFFAAGQKRDVYLMGNSAGGVHMSTFLFAPQYLEQRLRYAVRSQSGREGESESEGGSSVVLRLQGAINVAIPAHFAAADPDRFSVLQAYYGSDREIQDHSPYGLLAALNASGRSRVEVGLPRMVAAVGELDPEDEIAGPMKDFVDLWKETWGEEGLETWLLKGHNHISPPVALMSGDERAESWGEDVVRWIQKS